jgi:hypothetical protein
MEPKSRNYLPIDFKELIQAGAGNVMPAVAYPERDRRRKPVDSMGAAE